MNGEDEAAVADLDAAALRRGFDARQRGGGGVIRLRAHDGARVVVVDYDGLAVLRQLAGLGARADVAVVVRVRRAVHGEEAEDVNAPVAVRFVRPGLEGGIELQEDLVVVVLDLGAGDGEAVVVLACVGDLPLRALGGAGLRLGLERELFGAVHGQILTAARQVPGAVRVLHGLIGACARLHGQVCRLLGAGSGRNADCAAGGLRREHAACGRAVDDERLPALRDAVDGRGREALLRSRYGGQHRQGHCQHEQRRHDPTEVFPH